MRRSRGLHNGLAAAAPLVYSAPAQKAKRDWEYLKDLAFKSACLKALGPEASTPCLAKLDVRAPQDRFVDAGGERYAINALCRSRELAELWKKERHRQ